MTLEKALKIISEQAKTIECLENRIKELEDLLNKNSKNSSIPPSQDIHRGSSSCKNKSRKIGAQVGHKANFRTRLEPTEIINIDLPETCECGGKISKHSGTSTFQKVDIPEIKPIVTDYILEKGRCTKCKRKYTSKVPQGVTKDLLGPRVKSVITTLTGVYNNSKRDVNDILSNIFKIDICVGMIPKTTDRVSEKFSEKYDQILKNINNSALMHADETSFRVQTSPRRNWAWLVANEKNAYFKIADNRSRRVISELADGFNGFAITDRYPVYNYFSESKRQICLAHIKRDFEKFANSKFQVVSEVGKKMSDSLSAIFKIIKGSHDKAFCKDTRMTISKYISQIIYGLENLANFQLSKKIYNSAKNLLKHKKMFWKFLRIPWLSPTNNHAERLIRDLVIYRKKCFSVYGAKGKNFIEKIKSIYQTAKLNDQNIHEEILSLILG